MAFKGTAGKSSSGASMSKYDVEVEARLQKLESHTDDGVDAGELQGLKKAIFENSFPADRFATLEKKVDKLIAIVNAELHPTVRDENGLPVPIDWEE